MNKAGSAAKVKLNSFDDLFGVSDMTAVTDQVQEIPLSELYEFRGHPFKVLDDEKMQEMLDARRIFWTIWSRQCLPAGFRSGTNRLFIHISAR